jgi:HK97 family phage major capsid protein
MTTVERLQRKLAGIRQEQSVLLDAGIAEHRELTPDERASYARLATEQAAVHKALIDAQAVEERERTAVPVLVARADGTGRPVDLPPRAAVRLGRGRTYAEMFGTPAPNPFLGAEEFWRTVHSGLSDPRLMAASQNELTGGQGGFSVPDELVAEMLDASLEDEIVRPRAAIEPMAGPTKLIWSFDSSSAASGILYGGLTPTWIPEEGSIGIQATKLKMMTLTAHKLALLAVASNELLADGGSFEGDLQAAMTKGLGWGLDNAFLTGTGAGTPLGATKDTARVVVAKEVGQGTATILYENLANMLARLHPACYPNSVWVANPTTIPQLLAITIGVGTGGVTYPVIQESGKFFIFGRQVLFTEKVPVLGAEGDIGLYDFTQYAVGLRREVNIDKSMHLGFQTDQSHYRGIIRADGRGRWNKAYTPKNGSTLSWAVVLAVR